jgi:hypothetical protein
MTRAKRAAGVPGFWWALTLTVTVPLAGVEQEPPAEESRSEEPPAGEPAASLPLEEIVVVSRLSMLQETPAPGVALERRDIETLPHFGDDVYRAVKLLPGTTGNDFAAGFNVRGSLEDQVLVRLDGLEVYEPFHLKDFQGVFSIFDAEVIGGMELLPGAFPAEFGDRSAAVLDLITQRPKSRRHQLGISFSNAWLGSSGTFANGRGRWLGSARRGYLDIVLGLTESDEDDEQPDPRYWDLFGKLEVDASDRHRFSLQLLGAEDTLDFSEREDEEIADVDTSYGNEYLWGSHQAVLGSRSFVQTVASAGRVDRRRDAAVIDHDVSSPESFLLDDRRDVAILGLRQEWSLEHSRRHYFDAGFELRAFDADYDYADALERAESIDDPRFVVPPPVTRFEERFRGEQYSAWLSDRVRLARRLVAELGVRHDRQTLTEADQTSPRVNLLWDLGAGGALRLGWGHFFQSQRPHELDVEFGETEFQQAQRAEHWSLGWQGEVPGLGSLRAEAYRREERDPHERYETLFDPFQPIPQVALDLVRIAPERVVSEALELYLRGRRVGPLEWWIGYSHASTWDRIDGQEQPRSIDQPHAATLSLAYRPGERWTLSGVYRYHTGWPTTALLAEARFQDGERSIVYDVGPFYRETLASYQSLDLRVSRRSEIGRGALTFFLDVSNLTNRDNQRGLDLDDRSIRFEQGRFPVTFADTHWLPILPSFGVRWEF